MTDRPNPGSPEAEAQGCTCPVMDNARGAGAPGWKADDGGPLWWINAGCPLHGAPARPPESAE